MGSCYGDMGFVYSYLMTVALFRTLFVFEHQSITIDLHVFEPQLIEQSKSRHHDSAFARPHHRGCQAGQRYDEGRISRSDDVEQIHQMVNIRCPDMSRLPI